MCFHSKRERKRKRKRPRGGRRGLDLLDPGRLVSRYRELELEFGRGKELVGTVCTARTTASTNPGGRGARRGGAGKRSGLGWYKKVYGRSRKWMADGLGLTQERGQGQGQGANAMQLPFA